ncbi:hypothetical protein AO501_02770 [Mycobacterium gordonae]|uniref:DUF7937 domain-containing protein n=1 Tax=Mycobacterium gordonae TaxID=1778 RepID=A0A0Q2XAN6_MYCGO|nr:hypothetical protein AO501_02770 [Mycobacterium gordonae]
MSLNTDDTPTGPIVGARPAPPGPAGAGRPAPGPQPPGSTAQRRNSLRDIAAVVLLLLALVFPWNLYFGLGIPHSSLVWWGLLVLATLLSLVSILVARGRSDGGSSARLRLILNIPYLVLIVGFVLYDVAESILQGGTTEVPGGVGPGGWLGAAGALLAAQPALIRPHLEEQHYERWLRGARLLGYISMFGASLSAGFNLCWRVRYALQNAGGSEAFGTRNTTVILSAVVYGVVALTAVLVASRWILRNTPASRFAIFALGVSSLLAGMLVWALPAGREIDAFHGIAQNTSTAGVGYEGYLAWTAAAALFVPLTLFSRPEVYRDREVWRNAIRKGLTLIVVWCFGSALMRITDLLVAVLLNYPTFPYNSLTLATFDVMTAALALWLRVRLASGALRSRLITALSGLVVTLTVSRVILGVVLAPRFEQGGSVSPVYGNDLAQQITSTFDVTLCGLALFILAAVIVAAQIRKPRRRRRPAQRPVARTRPPVPIPTRPGAPPPPSEARTTRFGAAPTEHDAPTTVLSAPGPAPRIFRSSETTGPVRPKIFRPPNNRQ